MKAKFSRRNFLTISLASLGAALLGACKRFITPPTIASTATPLLTPILSIAATETPTNTPEPTATPTRAPDPAYVFDGSISRKVLEKYLSRAITQQALLEGWGNEDDNIRMLLNIGAKFAVRTFLVWGQEHTLSHRRKRPGSLPSQLSPITSSMSARTILLRNRTGSFTR